jgi:hypothetical protein
VRGARFTVVAALAALFCAGLFAAFGGGTGSAAEKIGTSTDSTVSTAATTEPTTEQQTTVQQTTVQLTVTNTHTIRSGPGTVIVTTTSTDTSSGTGTWALVAIGIAVVVLVALIVWLAGRHKEVPAETRRRVLADAVAAWVAQGWAPVSQTDTTAVLRRGADHLVLAVDAHGNISSQAVDPGAPGGAP